MLLNFKQWESQNLNEKDSSLEKIMNWLSSNFGGSIAKIDSLLGQINAIETQYSKDWNDIQTDIDALEIQKAQTKNDPAESKKLERMIDRNQKLLSALSRKRKADIDKIDSKVEKVTDGKSRLISYWNLRKAELEADLTEKLYKLAKQLTDDSVAEELYDKYKKAALEAKKKDESFRQKFGKLELVKSASIDKIEGDGEKPMTKANFSMDPIFAMNAPQFTKFVQSLEKGQVSSLIKSLQKERNERYATMDTERDRLEDQAEKKGFSKEDVKRDLKDLRETLMEQIRDLRTKITIARRYA
jgi:hypothetical protein